MPIRINYIPLSATGTEGFSQLEISVTVAMTKLAIANNSILYII